MTKSESNTSRLKISKERLKDVLFALSPIVVFAIIVVFVAYKYIDPAPPKHVKISAGDPNGNYFAAAKEYQELIKKDGIDLEILPSNGAWDNLRRLEDERSGVEIGFVQDGLGDRKKLPDVSSLGSIFYEPIWIFYRGKTAYTRLSQLNDKRIAVGEKGGETHTMAKKLLAASGVDEKNSQWSLMNDEDSAKALRAGTVDAGFFIASANEPLIATLMADPGLHLMNLDQADAMTRQFPYLHHLTLPHGTMDLAKNIPNTDVNLVAATATLVVRNSMHPALVYLFMKAATHVHRRPGIFEEKGEFPIDKDYAFPVNAGAKDYFKQGAPFWLRYLPFWLAVLIERFIFLILPTSVLVVPLLRLIPRFLNWRIRSWIHDGYSDLKLLEDKITSDTRAEHIAENIRRLDAIEARVNQMNFPVDVFDDVYVLREHIHFVRERLNRKVKSS
jgi:uncharacterized protein